MPNLTHQVELIEARGWPYRLDPMARRAFLHIGAATSGAPYLQDLWWRHRAALADRGLLLPGSTPRDHFRAATLFTSMDATVTDLAPREPGAWRRLLTEASRWDRNVLISHEQFFDSPATVADRAVRELAAAADEVHLVLTVRDLGRMLPAAWQHRVKHGARQPYSEFLVSVREQPRDQRFWRRHDSAGILARWTTEVPPEHVHLVVVPASGAPSDELWRRTGSAIGVEVADLDSAPRLPDFFLGIVETELLRRVNVVLPRGRRSAALTRLIEGSFARDILLGSAPYESFALPAKHAGWVRERSEAMVEALRGPAYDVVGDLGDLLAIEPGSGRVPDQTTDAEVLAAATTVAARWIEQER